MRPADVDTLKEIFHSARELRPNERKAFLDHACGTDEPLRREVEQLLESDRQSDGFIADPPAQLAAELFGDAQDGSDSGRVVGQYRLIECVGSGGMGAVYLAERADKQFEKQVAVKLIKRGMDSDAVLRRFQHERQILASLEHPNIARLLDGGTTEDGVPYFVMEYIKGERLDRYAEQRQLPITERLKLFTQVCSAVSFAHQRLVVHRDLKPSNILVTADGTPKLLDFGIAKIIQPNDSAEALATIATFTLLGAMTPEYASPEQIEGAPATTLSDVYSLGAVLYELLSARPPYQLPNRTPQALAKAIETGQVAKPSAVVNRPEDARRLRGDLDNIVLMAMRRDSARRYRSVEQFSDDIRRHLEGRPVIARRDTLSYRGGKFLQRNKVGVAAGALLLFTLVGGIVATVWQAHKARLQEQRAHFEQARAERRFNDVRKLANNVLFEYSDAIRNLPGATKVQERLVKDALNYLDSLAAEGQGDPALQHELAAAYDRVGDIRARLGDMAGAVESSTKAFRILEALVAVKPSDIRARHNLAAIHSNLGTRLLDTGEALKHIQTARTLFFDLAREQPANDESQREFATASTRLGNALKNRGDASAALEQFRTAAAICERLAAAHPQNQEYRRGLWVAQSGVAAVLWQQRNSAAAIAANDKAVALGEALVAEDPLNVEYRRALAGNYRDGGEYRRSDYRIALEYLRKALPLQEQLLAEDPANAGIRKNLGHTHETIANFLANLKEDNAQALSHFSKAREIFEKAASDAPGDISSRFNAAICGAGAAGMQARLGQVDPALEQCGKAAALLREIAEDPANAAHRGMRTDAYQDLAYAYEALAALSQASASEKKERMTAAREMHQQGLNVLEDLRSRGALDPHDQKWASEIAGEIASCDAALAK
ncbi:MAG: protein kinase domain-containing protein [Chthoniobacterales bacterium]